MSSWADVVRASAIDGIASLRDPEHLPLIREQTRYGLPNRGRRAAIHALGRVATDRPTRDHLSLLFTDTDPHVRADVVDALVAMGQPEALPVLGAQLTKETDPRVQRHLREALRDLGGKEPEASKQLADELAALKAKLSELEAKVSRLTPTPGEDPTANDAPSKDSKKRSSARAKKATKDAPRPARGVKKAKTAAAPKSRPTKSAALPRKRAVVKGRAKSKGARR
jgi:aminopeptidase N